MGTRRHSLPTRMSKSAVSTSRTRSSSTVRIIAEPTHFYSVDLAQKGDADPKQENTHELDVREADSVDSSNPNQPEAQQDESRSASPSEQREVERLKWEKI